MLSHSTLELVQEVLVHIHTIFLSLLIYCMTHHQKSYSLRPEILVGGMDVSRRILVLDTSIFMHLSDKYFRTEGVQETSLDDVNSLSLI